MAVELATAYIALVPSLKGAQGAIAKEFGGIGDQGSRAVSSGILGGFKGLARPVAAAIAALGIGRGIASVIRTGFEEASDAAAVNAQLAAGIASTGNAANVTVDELNALAGSIQSYSGQTDDSIGAAQGLLLTFTKIRNVGADKIFDRATAATADLAARMGGDAAGSAIQLGKALNDPVKGIASLTRVGIQFTDQQKEQIKTLVESGNVLEAQKIILGEIETQFGGSAAAYGQSLPGQVDRVKRAFEDLTQAATPGLTAIAGPILEGIISGLQALVPFAETAGTKLAALFPKGADGQVISFTEALDRLAQNPVVQFFGDLYEIIKPYLPTLASLYTQFSPVSIAFQNLAPYIPQLADGFKQLIEGIAPLIPQIISLIPPLLELIPPLVDLAVAVLPLLPPLIQVLVLAVSGIVQGLKIWAESTKGLFTGLELLFGMLTGSVAIDDFLAGIRDIPGPFGAVLRVVTDAGTQFGNFFHGIIVGVRDFVSGVGTGIGQVIGFFQQLPGRIASFVGGIAGTLVGAGRDLINGFIQGIKNAFGGVKDTLASLTKLLPSWKGPQSLDKVILKESGQLVINGFINGLESRYGAVRSSLGDLTSGLVPTAAYAGVTSTTSSAALSGVGTGGFANYGTIVTQDVDEFIEKMRKDQRRAQALEGLDGVSIA